jgi:hypothetical protein
MMSLSSHTFWIEYESGKLLESFTSGAQAKSPVFIQGDTAKVEVHLLRRNGSNREEISIPAGATLKMGIGRLESQPTAGTFKIGYKGIASAEIPFNASASALETALNGIPDVDTEGGISVETAGDAFLLTWNSGNTHDPLTSDPDELFPSSQVILVGQVVGDVQKVLLHLQQSPVAFLQTFTAMGNPVLTSTLLATIGSKKVYRISIAPNPAGGSFYISGTNSNGTLESPGISVNATSTDVLNALPATIQTDASVIKSGTYSWDISISSANSLTADGSGLIGWLGVEGFLSLNTVQIHEFLNARESGTAVLEIMVSESTGETTILQTACSIVADLIDEGSVAPLDLTPPLSEGVANNRYVRKDIASAPSDATQDIIWQNLGVTIDGSTVVDAIDGASSPSGGNPFATIDDVEDRLALSGGAISGNLTISGRAGIGGGLANNSAHKLAIHDGNIIFSSGFGIAFGDGTTLTTATTTPDLTGYATESWVTSQDYITSSALTGYASESWVQSQGFASETWVQSQGYLTSAPPPSLTNLTTDISWDGSIGRLIIGGVVEAGEGGFYSARLNFPSGGGVPSQPEDGDFWRDASKFKYQAGGLNTIASEQWVLNQGYITGQAVVDEFMPFAGGTFNGKVNMAAPTAGSASLNLGVGTAPTTSVAGDIWIATNINYRDAAGTQKVVANTNTSNTYTAPQIIQTTVGTVNAALRITQLGTGNALLVEDQNTPDTSALVVDASGNVGIGVATGYTSTSKVEVVGNVKADTFSNGSGPAFSINSTAAHTGGPDTLDAIVTINGVNYRIGLRPA